MKKIILKVLFLVFVGLFVFFIVNGIIENISIDTQINDFIKKGNCEKEVIHQATGDIVLCKVSRETYYKNQVNKPSITVIDDNLYLGSVGDIVVRKSSPFGIPLLNEFVTFFIGGHASVISSDYKKTVEVSGTSDKDYVLENENGWMYTKNPIIGLRVYNATMEDYKAAYQKSLGYLGDKYNYSFLFNTEEKHYCTDLIMKAWSPSFSLNDGFVTTINDLICSPNTYISFYKYTDGNNVTYIYYLD